MDNYIKKISQYLNNIKYKGQYVMSLKSNGVIELHTVGKLKNKMNNDDEFYHEFKNFIDNLGLDMDLIDLETLEIWEK